MLRLNSLDVFRGITITLMILVNSPGNHTAYSWLRHSAWNGCTLADLVFPFFILIGGISIPLSITHLKYKNFSQKEIIKKILFRSLYLFALGLLLNMFPHFDLSTLRILGVLQRIALCYLFASLMFLTTSIYTQFFIFISLLVSYAFLIQTFPDSVNYIDKLILSPQHLYNPNFDPEGLLSTLPSFATALLGNIIGFYFIQSHKNSNTALTEQLKPFYTLLLSGCLLIGLGWLWQMTLPLNKSLWSSSYVLWSGGWGLIVFAVCFFLIEIKKYAYGNRFFMLLGKNSLWLYMFHVVFLKIQAMILISQTNGEIINLRLYLTEHLFNSWSSNNASLAYAILYTVFGFLCLLIKKCCF